MKSSICRLPQPRRALALIAGVAALSGSALHAQTAEEFQQLKAAVQQMQKTIDGLNSKIDELEKAKAAPPPPAPPVVAPPPSVPATNNLAKSSPSIQTMEKIAAGQAVSERSPVEYRHTLNDPQEA